MRPTSVLIVAHPGHELRLFQWLCQTRPQVIVLTDGSGGASDSRLRSTVRMLRHVGAYDRSMLGLFSDRELYRNILERNHDAFLRIAASFARLLRDNQIGTVVGDAIEGYNPGHDVCRLLINAAVEAVALERALPLRNYDYAVVGHPAFLDHGVPSGCVTITLDQASLQKKLRCSREYPELKHDVDMALSQYGEGAFGIECLRPVVTDQQRGYLQQLPPHYELYGEQQVKKGLYKNVIRYREHILPLKSALDEWVRRQRFRRAG